MAFLDRAIDEGNMRNAEDALTAAQNIPTAEYAIDALESYQAHMRPGYTIGAS
jgi:hypothetical protein